MLDTPVVQVHLDVSRAAVAIVLSAAALVLQAQPSPLFADPFEALRAVELDRESYGWESRDWSVEPISFFDFSARGPTPVEHPLAVATLTTRALRDLILSKPSPLLLYVGLGDQTVSLPPGSVWIDDAASEFPEDRAQAWREALRSHVLALLEGLPPDPPVVVFCSDPHSWRSYNFVTRLGSLGFSNLYWHRGGRVVWHRAALPVEAHYRSPWRTR